MRWFDRNHKDGWATCPLTQSGFIRVSSNAHILPGACSPREALAVLRRIVALPGHIFWPDDISIALSLFIDETKLHGHRQVSDIHLLAVALRNEGRLATLDRGIMHLVPTAYAFEDVVSVVIGQVPSA